MKFVIPIIIAVVVVAYFFVQHIVTGGPSVANFESIESIPKRVHESTIAAPTSTHTISESIPKPVQVWEIAASTSTQTLSTPKPVHALTNHKNRRPAWNYTILGDHIFENQLGGSKPGTPEFAYWTGEPFAKVDDAWRVTLAERLVNAASARDAMERCGSFISIRDYTWCERALPQLGNLEIMKAFGFRQYVVDNNILVQKRTNPDDLLGISLGIRDGDPWSEAMSSIYFVKTRLFDCYWKGPAGPIYNDMHNGFSKDQPCTKKGCYSVEYEPKKICIDDHNDDRVTRKDKRNRSLIYEPLSMALNGQTNLSVFLKVDIEGSEWLALEKLLDNEADMAKIRSIDMETHMQKIEPQQTHVTVQQALTRNVEIMEKLADKFAVTGSSLEAYSKHFVNEYIMRRKLNPKSMAPPFGELFAKGGIRLDQYCISFVNRKLL